MKKRKMISWEEFLSELEGIELITLLECWVEANTGVHKDLTDELLADTLSFIEDLEDELRSLPEPE